MISLLNVLVRVQILVLIYWNNLELGKILTGWSIVGSVRHMVIKLLIDGAKLIGSVRCLLDNSKRAGNCLGPLCRLHILDLLEILRMLTLGWLDARIKCLVISESCRLHRPTRLVKPTKICVILASPRIVGGQIFAISILKAFIYETRRALGLIVSELGCIVVGHIG